MPLDSAIRKVLVIGSGPIVIGQAAEFDYAGAQACRVLKDAGINVVLVNSNPATIMTDRALADEIYLEPLTVDTVKRIIEKEKPDSVLATLGGQTGLTVAMKLDKEGFLAAHGVRLLGTNAEAIDKAEDRELFKETMLSIDQPCIPSDIAEDLESAVKIAARIGYPVIVRPAFTLGGAGGGVAYGEEQFRVIAKSGLHLSPISQILVEKYIYGWKEIEFEAMRDANGNCITICSMENVDPVGVHTGDSIVVAPALTLADEEYQMLRSASLKIITALGIEGGCNCQFALNPETKEYAVIEVNPRVSRSSALASKATGFPIAKVAVKIALGYTLDEIRNDVTGKTYACFEPSVDYVVVKFPKWPFDKFVYAKRVLGTQMKATGEVMAIGANFESALLKAVRGAEIGRDTLDHAVEGDIREKLREMTDERIFNVYAAIKQGVSTEEIHAITMIDEWFIEKLRNLHDYERTIEKSFSRELYMRGKKLGYTDAAIERISGRKIANPARAVYKMVDTCAGEFAAATPYFYSTYDEENESVVDTSGKRRVIVFGSGPIRIGQGIEFDYSSVHCVWALKNLGFEVIIVNNNPETVSTDFDTADKLYFEPLTKEDVKNIIDLEQPYGVVVAFGGQTAIKLTKFLSDYGVNILGTPADSVDVAEDRERFDELLESLSIKRPKGLTVMTVDEALEAADKLGYPVLVRPSYVIGGQNMIIAFNEKDIRMYMAIILEQNIENPVLVDKYMMGSELEVDVICDGEEMLIPGIMQHIERTGVHSGDSIAVYPPYNINDKLMGEIVESSRQLALALKTKGLLNIQYLIYQNQLYVIEVNPRASRTVPYISKVTGVPMVDLATRIMVGEKLKDMGYGTGLYKEPPYFAVKVPVFSFEKLSDVNSLLGPEMKSTGEVLGVGADLNEALFKGFISAGFNIGTLSKLEPKGVYISVNDNDKLEILKVAKKFSDMGIKIYATKGTAGVIAGLGTEVEVVERFSESDQILKLLEAGKIDYIVYTTGSSRKEIDDYSALHRHAVRLSIACLTSLDTANALADIIACRYNEFNTELVDINRMRTERQTISFTKMMALGSDYIYIRNFDGALSAPESLAISLCDRRQGIGGDGIVFIENSDKADAKMRVFNPDGSEGRMAGNAIRCVGKYLYDTGLVRKEEMEIETLSGVKKLRLFIMNGKVNSASVFMGQPAFEPEAIPMKSKGRDCLEKSIKVGGKKYTVSALSVGNPHCVVFCDKVDGIDVETVGRQFEFSEYFPERVNTEFVRVVNERTLKMRVWERGNGETLACGTGACAAVVAAVKSGKCRFGEEITVKVRGGDLFVLYDESGITLTGEARHVFDGTYRI